MGCEREQLERASAGEDCGELVQRGIEDNKLMRKLQPHLLETFDDTFNEAVQQLVRWGGVILGEDAMLVPLSGYRTTWLTAETAPMSHSGKRYLAHETPNMTWDCVLTVKARETWNQYQRTVFRKVSSHTECTGSRSTDRSFFAVFA